MNIQPIDLPSLLHAVMWPLLAIIAVVAFQRPLANLVAVLGSRVNKLSVGKFSIEMAQVQEIKPGAVDTEIRQLEASSVPQSGSSGLSALVNELQSGGKHDYVVIDLGSESSPRWLTSRLYLLCFLMTLIDRQPCMVFVETVGSVRKQFIGVAAPERVRWALARNYSWLESAGAAAYAMHVGGYCSGTGFQLFTMASNHFDPTTGSLRTIIPSVIKQFLSFVSSSQAPAERAAEWLCLDKQQTYEHAKWLDGARIESLLGSDLSAAHVTLLPNATVDDLTDPVLAQKGRFVAIVDQDKTFRGLVDRLAALEGFAGGKQARSRAL